MENEAVTFEDREKEIIKRMSDTLSLCNCELDKAKQEVSESLTKNNVVLAAPITYALISNTERIILLEQKVHLFQTVIRWYKMDLKNGCCLLNSLQKTKTDFLDELLRSPRRHNSTCFMENQIGVIQSQARCEVIGNNRLSCESLTVWIDYLLREY